MTPKLTPPQTKGHISVANLPRWWYVACRSEELGSRPHASRILGTPLVLFRNRAGQPAALLDRCPHRNVPLSLGAVNEAGDLECGYHGWCFKGDGTCSSVPGLIEERDPAEIRGRRATPYPVRERDGFVWVWLDADQEPDREPFALPAVGEQYTRVERQIDVRGSVHAAVENALDVPHTAYLHKGLFRGGTKNEVTVRISRWHDRVEAEYIGEPRPSGLVGRILSPSGGIVEHWDRFFLPSVSQVEYRLGPENHVIVTALWTPIEDFYTRMFAVIQFNVRAPGWAVRPVLEPAALKIFQQDAEILARQTDAILEFGGEQYVSTDVDTLGPHIWRLLRQAERGDEPSSDEPVVKEIRMLV